MSKKVKKVVSRVREGSRRVPTTLSWRTFVGADGAIYCKPYGDAPQHMRPRVKN